MNKDRSDTTSEKIPFRGFDERGNVRVYNHGLLPHWRQTNCTYFVTFRLADSLPNSVIREFECERNQWLQSRKIDIDTANDNPINWQQALRRLSDAEQRQFVRLMATRLNALLDAGYGVCLLRRPDVREVVSTALTFFHGTRVLTGDHVVMPNHVHALLRPINDYELEDILLSIKSYTANRINQMLNQEGRVWMRESHDHIVRDFEQLEAFQRYIRANPVKAQLKQNEFTYHAATFSPDE